VVGNQAPKGNQPPVGMFWDEKFMCRDESGEGILKSNLRVIYILSGQQPMVKKVISPHSKISTIKSRKFNNEKSTKNLKKGKE